MGTYSREELVSRLGEPDREGREAVPVERQDGSVLVDLSAPVPGRRYLLWNCSPASPSGARRCYAAEEPPDSGRYTLILRCDLHPG
jgi:hypothetical protein